MSTFIFHGFANFLGEFGFITCSPFSGLKEFVKVLSSDSQWKLAESFNLSLPWGFLIHGWTDSMFKDPKWQLNERGI